MKKSLPSAPRYLSKQGKAWWRRILEEFELGDSSLLDLELTLQAFDRWQAARELLDKEGTVIKDRFEQDKLHPAVLIERDSRFAVLRGLRQLGLDLAPLNDGPGRPAGALNKR
jgi:P27 family predicted phage terminase small subunit